MSYLVDTDWVADWLAGKTAAVTLLTSASSAGLAISLITFGEIYEGIYYGRDPKAADVGFRNFLRQADVLPLNRPIMRRFAQIRGDLRRKGRLISDPDLLIAATAIHHDLMLMTRNVRDFQRVPALKLYLSH